MEVEKLERLEELLRGKTREEIVGQEITRLTEPGENYGSLMLKLDVKTKSKEGEEKTLHTVAKLVPPNKISQQIFNTKVTFKDEIAWYATIIPLIQEHVKEHTERSFDFFPELYGARISLDPKSNVVDDGAALVLENLIMKGYKNVDRTVGFDFEMTKEILKVLSLFHAAVISMKLQKPQLFNDSIKPFLSGFEPPSFEDSSDHNPIHMVKRTFEHLKDSPETAHLIHRLEDVLKPKPKNSVREPWATALHNDFWVNNIMLKYEGSKPPKCKIVDLQVTEYRSVAGDLIFFLFSSVNTQVLKYRLEHLIQYYYDQFIQHLKELKVDTGLFLYSDFVKELKIEASSYEINHILFMWTVIFAQKEQFLMDAADKNFSFDKSKKSPIPKVTLPHKERLSYAVQEWAKRNWI